MKLKTYSYKKVISTNKTAINKIKSGINKGIIVSDQQTNGRGSHGKKWISYKGNLFVSLFFKIDKLKISFKKLTRLNCLLVRKIISNYYKKKIVFKFNNSLL